MCAGGKTISGRRIRGDCWKAAPLRERKELGCNRVSNVASARRWCSRSRSTSARAACRFRRRSPAARATSYGTRRSSTSTRPGRRVDDAVLRPVPDSDLARPPLAERLADAARVDDHGRAVAAQHLQVGVAADEHGRGRLRRTSRSSSSSGVEARDPVGERARRAVEAEQRRRVVERYLERRSERANEGTVLVGQLLRPPAADLVEHDRDGIVSGRESRPETSCPSSRGSPGSPSSRTRPRHSCTCGPKQMSPRQMMRSGCWCSRSARTASSAGRLPWMSEMSPTRMPAKLVIRRRRHGVGRDLVCSGHPLYLS